MFRKNNPDIDTEALEQRVAIEADRPEADPRAFPAAEAPAAPPGDPAATRLGRIKVALRAVPVLGPMLGRLNALRRRLDLRRRLHAVPVLGTGLRWIKSLLTLTATRRRLDDLEAREAERLHELQVFQHRVRASVHEAQGEVRAVQDRLEQVRGEILFQQQRLDRMTAPTTETAGARDAAASPNAAPENAAPEAAGGAAGDARLANFYEAFEDRFRGARAAVKARHAVYLDDLRAAGAGTSERPVLDLGCGRGEFLELLGESGLQGAGVDANMVAVRTCQSLGLDAHEGDLLAVLGGCGDASRGAVTAFHVIEHLPLNTLIAVLDEARRVLAPGGVLILETPNPENLRVGAHSFWNDPTHRAPIPPEVARFMVEQRGFADAAIRRLHPYPEDEWLTDTRPERDLLNMLLFGPQDYAVLAQRR